MFLSGQKVASSVSGRTVGDRCADRLSLRMEGRRGVTSVRARVGWPRPPGLTAGSTLGSGLIAHGEEAFEGVACARTGMVGQPRPE